MTMRLVPLPDDGFRVQAVGDGVGIVTRNYVPPVPIGTIVVKAFRVTGYDSDCDGQALARLEAIDSDGEATGWTESGIGFFGPIVTVDHPRDLSALAKP